MSRPIRRVRGLAFFSLILLVGSLVRAEAQLPKVRITLMPDVPYENVFGHYVLYGPFGAHAGFVRKPGSRTLQIPVVVEGKPASQIKMFIGAPGCKMATFDIPILNLLDTQEPFSCSPAPTVTLVGQIGPASMLGNKDATVSVDYRLRSGQVPGTGKPRGEPIEGTPVFPFRLLPSIDLPQFGRLT